MGVWVFSETLVGMAGGGARGRRWGAGGQGPGAGGRGVVSLYRPVGTRTWSQSLTHLGSRSVLIICLSGREFFIVR